MSNSGDGLAAIAVVVSIAMFIGGCCMGEEMTARRIHKDAIEHGYAIHNPHTGEWEWKDKGKEEAKK